MTQPEPERPRARLSGLDRERAESFGVIATLGGTRAALTSRPPRVGSRSTSTTTANPAFGAKRVERITADDVEQWRDELIDERGLSRRTANKLLINLGAILERGVKHHGLIRNVANRTHNRADLVFPGERGEYVKARP